MNVLNQKFNTETASKAQKAAYPPPFSIRLAPEERARLDVLRGNKPLGSYIREKLFENDAAPRNRGRTSPVPDAEALGRVLGALGQCRLSSNLNQLAKAVNSGSLPVTPETESDLAAACRDIAAMRADLLRALGTPLDDGP